ncbi:MAG: nucleotidyltransferase domain-containing protein [Deltaproteobacteria bacterium]|nr:nucleotidyltransferase domain-containing protein [Deltaproteobacteria bacterium]
MDERILARLRDACASSPVRFAIVFGSRAAGRPRPDSDLDIGLWPASPDMPLRDELELASALSAAAGMEVDLVRLDRDDPLLGREVARDGICLYERTKGACASYRARAMSWWADFDETIAPHRERMLRRLAEGARDQRGPR